MANENRDRESRRENPGRSQQTPRSRQSPGLGSKGDGNSGRSGSLGSDSSSRSSSRESESEGYAEEKPRRLQFSGGAGERGVGPDLGWRSDGSARQSVFLGSRLNRGGING